MMQDKNNIPKLIKVLRDLERMHVEVGIFGENDSQILIIAGVHEFGAKIQVTPKMRNFLHSIGIHLRKETEAINIPERSFIRAGFDENVSKIQQQAEILIDDVLSLKIGAKAFYEALGGAVVSMFQDYLTEISSPPLSSVTIERKGSSNPLIDTGRLRQAITYRVVSG